MYFCIQNFRYFIFLILSLFLLSCATPAGKLTEADFTSKILNVSFGRNEAVSNFLEGQRQCGFETGSAFNVVHHGNPRCLPENPSGQITCDIYMGMGNMIGNDYVSGRIIFTPQNNGTRINISAINRFRNKQKMLEAWEKFIQGDAKEICP